MDYDHSGQIVIWETVLATQKKKKKKKTWEMVPMDPIVLKWIQRSTVQLPLTCEREK